MRIATIYWDGDAATVKWTKEFLSSWWLTRADAIQDIENETSEQYKIAMSDFEKWHRENQKKALKQKEKNHERR